MCPLIFILILLQLPLPVKSLAGSGCFSKMKHRAHMDGDVLIAGFFPLYTLGTDGSNSDGSRKEDSNPFIFKNYQLVLALAFAVEGINKNSHLLHNLTLGFDIYDVQCGDWLAFKNHFTCLFGKYKSPNYSCMKDIKSIAVITGPSGLTSSQIGMLLSLYRYPQLTFGPFDHALNDHNKFPALYQMAPKDTSMATVMVSLLLHFNWNWVGMFTVEDENGLWILPELKKEMAKRRVCIAFELVIPTNAVSYALKIMSHYNQINKSSSNILIIYGDDESLLDLMKWVEQVLIKGKVCILNSQWELTLRKRYFLLGSFHVPLIFSHHHPDVSGFTDFFKAVSPSKYPEDFFLAQLWFLSFNCSISESDCVTWENCPHDASLDWLPSHNYDLTMSGNSYNIHNAVYYVAQALHEMLLLQTEMQTMGNQKGTVSSPAQLHAFLKNIQFNNPAGNLVILDERRKFEAEYDIVNIWNFPEGLQLEVKVGTFSPYALHGHQLSLSEDMVQWAIGTTELHAFLKNIQFNNPAGNLVILDERRKFEAEYDIVNIWNFPEGLQLEVKVGTFSPYALHGHQLSLSEDMVQWAIGTTETPHSVCSESCGPGYRKSPQEGEAVCCFDCTPCPENEIANGTDMEQCVKCTDHHYSNTERNQCLLRAVSFLAYGEPLGIALASVALGLSTLTAVVLGVFVKHHNTPIVKANNQALSYILLISLIFCFLCSLLFIGRPNSVTCILQQTTFGVTFTIAVSAVLAKTVTVVMVFKFTSPGRTMRWLLVSRAPNIIIPICTLIQVILCAIWLGTSPPFIDTDAHSEHGLIIILCNKGSVTAFYCVLVFLASLALASFTVAFLARNLPDIFNEAKFLTFSMLVFCSVWLTFLPVYHSAKGKLMVAIEVFSILTSSAGLLGCIFAPKCYIILLRPDRNVLHALRNKMHIGKNNPS